MWVQIILKEDNVVRLSVVLDNPTVAVLEDQLRVAADVFRGAAGSSNEEEDSYGTATARP